ADLGSTTEEMYPHRFRTLTPEWVVATAVAKAPAHEPRQRQEYRNIHYTALGLLIEKVTGDRYAQQAPARVFRPPAMRHTRSPSGADPRTRAALHLACADTGGRTTDVTEWKMSARWAAGAMMPPTAGLERLVVGLFPGEVVRRR